MEVVPNNKNFGQAKNFPFIFYSAENKENNPRPKLPLKGDSPDEGLEGGLIKEVSL